MRWVPLVIFLLLGCASVSAQTGDPAEGSRKQPATDAYVAKLGEITYQSVLPQLAKHPDRFKKGAILNAIFRVDIDGQVKELKVFSTKPNTWAEAIAKGTILAAKFPRPSAKVIAEQGHDWVEIQAQWTLERQASKPSGSLDGKNLLRFDGFYCCERDSSVGKVTFYLRFYPDGVVLSVPSIGKPREVAKWFNRNKQEKFRYSTQGDSLEFEDENADNRFVYSGTISPDHLTLRVDGYDRKSRKYKGSFMRTYKFVHLSLSP